MAATQYRTVYIYAEIAIITGLLAQFYVRALYVFSRWFGKQEQRVR